MQERRFITCQERWDEYLAEIRKRHEGSEVITIQDGPEAFPVLVMTTITEEGRANRTDEEGGLYHCSFLWLYATQWSEQDAADADLQQKKDYLDQNLFGLDNADRLKYAIEIMAKYYRDLEGEKFETNTQVEDIIMSYMEGGEDSDLSAADMKALKVVAKAIALDDIPKLRRNTESVVKLLDSQASPNQPSLFS